MTKLGQEPKFSDFLLHHTEKKMCVSSVKGLHLIQPVLLLLSISLPQTTLIPIIYIHNFYLSVSELFTL